MHALLSAPLSAAPVFLAYPNPLTIWIPTGTISLVFHEFNSYMTTSGLKKKKGERKINNIDDILSYRVQSSLMASYSIHNKIKAPNPSTDGITYLPAF